MISEVELGHRVSSWLADQEYELFPEVQVNSYGKIADIVARKGRLLVVVELKTRLSFRVVEQASHWIGRAHMVYIAVATEGQGRLMRKILDMLGIGLLVSGSLGTEEMVRPSFYRRTSTDLKRALERANPTYAEAGNSNGKRWTPFKATCEAVLLYVQENPGARIKEIVDNVKTHYSSPKTAHSCIIGWAKEGKIPGICLKRDGHYWTVWPEEHV